MRMNASIDVVCDRASETGAFAAKDAGSLAALLISDSTSPNPKHAAKASRCCSLQASGVNKDEAVGNALKSLEDQWSKQAQSLQQVSPNRLMSNQSINSYILAPEPRFVGKT
jgi:hypothetical protein